MAGLTDQAGGSRSSGKEMVDQAQQAWQESMLRRLEVLRSDLHARTPQEVADKCGGTYEEHHIRFKYWDRTVVIAWTSLDARYAEDGKPCSTFDIAMLIYYLHTADGAALADRWIAFRELPSGGFYHQAFQGYSGNLVARHFGNRPENFDAAALKLGGLCLTALAPHAYAFQPLPRIRLAAALWPGDEDFTAHASILFDAGCDHYMTTDGLALLGAGLSRRLIRTGERGSST